MKTRIELISEDQNEEVVIKCYQITDEIQSNHLRQSQRNARPSPAISDSGQQTCGSQTEASVSGGNALPAGNAPALSVLQ